MAALLLGVAASSSPADVTVTQIGAWGGSVDAIDVHQFGEQRIAYIGSGVRVVILDVTDPGNIIELSSVMLDSVVMALKVRDGYAYVGTIHLEYGSSASSFCVIDVHDPTAPVLVAGGIGGPSDPGPVSWSGGRFNTIVLDGNRPIAFVSPHSSAPQVFDISDPTAPIYKGERAGGNEPVMSGSLMYWVHAFSGTVGVADTSTLDLNDPATDFSLIGFVEIPEYRRTSDYATASALAGDYLYVAAQLNYDPDGSDNPRSVIFVVDFSDLTTPVHVGTWDVPTSDSFRFAADLTISDGRLYWAGSGGPDPLSRTLVILDIATDPTNPTLIGTYSSAASFIAIDVLGTTAYLGDAREGFTILDCSDPTNPQRVGNYFSPGAIHQAVLDGSKLYVTDYSHGFSILDVSDPASPGLMGKWETGTYTEDRRRMQNWGIAVRDDLAYVAAGSAGLQVVDVRDPSSPVLRGEFSPWPDGSRSVGLTLSPNEQIVHVGTIPGGWIVNFDVSDPSNIVQVGAVDIGGNMAQPRSIERRSDGIAYVAREHFAATLDLTDPANPILLGLTGPPAVDVAMDGGLLYTAADVDFGPEGSGLYVLNMDPLPVPLGHYGSDDGNLEGYAVAASSPYVFAAFNALDLRVLDTRRPDSPVLVGKAPSAGAKVNDLIVDGDILYAITRDSNGGGGPVINNGGGGAGVLVYRVAPPVDKNRYLSFRPSAPGAVAYKLDMVSSLFHPTATVSGWVGAPDANGISSIVPDPVTRTWTEAVVDITGCEIAPVAEFELRASTDGGTTFLPPTLLQTIPQPGGGKWWGDTVGSFDGTEWSPRQGVTNIDDAVAAIKTWQGAAGAPEVPRTDVVPQEPNRVVNFNDVFFLILAFQGDPYPFGCPSDPCRDNVASPCD